MSLHLHRAIGNSRRMVLGVSRRDQPSTTKVTSSFVPSRWLATPRRRLPTFFFNFPGNRLLRMQQGEMSVAKSRDLALSPLKRALAPYGNWGSRPKLKPIDPINLSSLVYSSGAFNQPALSTTVSPMNKAVSVHVTLFNVVSALLVLVNS